MRISDWSSDVCSSDLRGLIAADIREAEALGHRVRLIGMAERDGADKGGGLYQHVQPCLVPADHPLAYVPGALNAVVAEGNFVGRPFFEGAGAGAGPTASAIVRSAERRVGQDWVGTCRSRWSPP